MPYTLAEQEKNRRIKAEENRRYYEALAKKQEEEEAKRKEQREKRRQEIDAIQNGEPTTDPDAPEGSLFMGADKMWSNIANNPQAMRNRNDAFEDERISLVEEDKDFSKRLDRTTQREQQRKENLKKEDQRRLEEYKNNYGKQPLGAKPGENVLDNISSYEESLERSRSITNTKELYKTKDTSKDTNQLKNDIYSRYIKNGKLDNLIDFKYYVRNGKINDDNIYLFTDNSNLTKDQKETFKKIFEKEKNIAKKQLREKLVALKDRIEKSDDYSSLNKNANIHQINNALEILDAPDKSGNALTAVGNYFKGIGNHLTDSDLWSVGVTQLNRSRYTNNAAEEFDKNYKALKKQYKNLTDEEIGQRAFQNLSKKHQDALTTYYALMQAQDFRGYDTSLAYQAGQVTADMLPFAISLASSKALNGVLKLVARGVRTGIKATTRAINIAAKGGKVLSKVEEIEALTKGALRGAKSGFKSGLPKILGGKGATSEITEAGTTFKGVNYGKNLGKDLKNSLADALTATVISPNSWANLEKEKADKHIAHEDFTLKDYARVWSSNFVENATETMSATLFRPFRTAYNMALDKAFHIKPSYLLNNKNFSDIYHNKMYIGGTFEELMEEYLGAGWNTMNGYILGDDELKKEWSNFMTKDSQAVLYASIVPSTMIMPVASGGLRMLHNHQNSKAYRKAKETLNDLFNNYGLNASNLTNVVEASISCGGFTDTGNNNYVQNVANALIGAVQTSYGQEEAKRVTAQVQDYIAKAHRLNGTLRSFSQDVMNMSAEERENLCKELADAQERVAYNNVIYSHIKHGRYLTLPDSNGQEENYLAQAFTIDENGNLVQLGVVTDRFTNDKGEDAFRIRDAFGSEFDMTLNELNRAVEHTALENNPIVFTRVSDALDYLEGQTEQGSREANEIQTRRLLNNIGVSVNANGERVVVSATLKDADGNVSNAFVSNINEQSNSAIAYYIDEDGNIRSRQVSLDEIETIEEKTIEQAIDETNKIFTAYNMGVEQYQEQYQQARDLNQTLDKTLPPSHTEQTQQPTDQTTDEQETTDDEQETEQDNGIELQEGVDYNINALEYLQEGDLITITDFGGYEELRDVEGVEGKVAYTDENGVVVEYTENGVVVRQVAIKRDYNRITFTYNGHTENNVSVTNEQNVDEGATSATEDTNGNNNQVGETENNSVTAETETAQNEQQTNEPQQTAEQQETETTQEETAEQQTTEQQESTQPVAEQTQEPTTEQQPTEQPKQEQEVAEQTQSKPTQQTEQEEVTEGKQTTETAQEEKTKEKEEQKTENKDVAEKQIDNTKWKNSNKIDGRRSRKVLADNTELKGHYVIVEADSLTPSHSPFTFGQNENFPTNKDGKTMNSRDYQTKEEQGKVIRIAQNYGKQAVMDAPIVDNNGIVLSGNGRTMAGQLASRQHTDKEYLDYLKEISEEEFGISPEQYEDMKSPRVVFVLDNDMEYTTANFDKFNRKGEESQSTTARAVVVSKSVTEKQVKEIGEWLSNAIDNSPSNLKIETILKQNGQEVISLLVKVGILQPNETAQYIDTNERGQRVLNGNGVDFITGVLYGVCFNERGVQVCMSWQNSIGTTIIASINEIIANKNLSGGFSLIDDLQEALNVVAQCLQEKTTIDAYFGQTSMFGEDSLKTRTVKMLAELIMSKDIKELKNVLISYNKYALQTIENPNNLFGETIDKERVLTDIIKQYEREKQQRKHTGKQTSTSDSSQKSERVTQTNSNTDRGTSTTDSNRRTTEQDKQGKGEEVKNHRTTTPTTQLTEEDKALTSALIDVMQHSNGKLEVITDEQWANEILDRENERGGEIQERRVYHGSGAEFTEFDHSKMSTGEGNQAHGWGTYVAVDRKTSEAYTEYLGKYFCKCKGIHFKSPRQLARFITDRVFTYFNENNLDEPASEIVHYWNIISNAIENVIINSHSKENLLEVILEIFPINSDIIRGYLYDVFKGIGLDKVEYGKQQGFLYTIEIPDRTKNRYLDEDKVNKELNQKIIDAFVKDHVFIENEFTQLVNRISKWKDYTGKALYETLSKEFGSDELASKFLNSIGIVGIHYNGRLDGECYVIFNEKDLQIKNKEKIQFFKTSKGECYGFTVGGKIYIDTRIAKADTPIHEFTHLWARALRENNPEEWKNIVALMKKQTHLWEYVKNLYPELTDEDAIADEVLAHFSGKRGLERLEAEQKRLREDKSMNLFAKARAMQAIKNVKQALERFWKDVADFLHIHFTTAEEVADKVLADLLNGVNPNEFIKEENNDIQLHKVEDKSEIERLEGEKKVKVYRAMQMQDGKLYPPMSAKERKETIGKNGEKKTTWQWREPAELGVWEKAEEHPENANADGTFTLNKGNNKSIKAAYNPYIHTSRSPINDQFSEAWKRPELVVVEVEVPESELTSGYRAEKSKNSVGETEWKAGAVSRELAKNGDARKVILSRYDKPIRVVPTDEVAKEYAKRLNKHNIGVPFNTVPPTLREALVKEGVKITAPEKSAGEVCRAEYEKWNNQDNETDRKVTDAKGETIAEVNSDNVVEMNYETWTNKETGDKVALRKFFKRLGLDDNTIKEMIEYGDAVAEAMQRFMDEFPLFAQFQNKKASKRPFIKDMGEYITIDYSYNCIKKEALNSIIEVLIQEGKSGHLGETQIEAIKNILQKNDFLVSCAMCYVEAKRRILKQAKRDEMIWNNVCKAVGLKNDFIATYIDGKFVTNSVELTAEQEEFLNKLIKGDEEALNKVENYSEKSGEGIKKDSIIKVAKLILNNDTLRGNLNYEWFMTPKRFSAFYETFADTGITEYLSEGQYRGKQLLDAIPFSFYSLINNNSAMIEGEIGNSYSMLLRGGIRQFSYEDARAIMFFDYFTQFLLLQGMRLPLQMYTKRPFMPAMFGLSGAKINQSLVVDVWTGADWHRDKLGLSEKEYTQWLKDHAGFVPKGALSKDDKRYKQDSMELVPLWSDASFPVDIAIENSQNKAFDGNVGNTALAPSIEFIKWALDNEDIHQILPYHSGGASNTFKETKGYHLATDMNDGYLTKNKNGKKVDDIEDLSIGIRIKNGKLEFSRLLIECDNDAHKATQVYLDFCKKNGLTPMFNYEGVVDHPNYYKLLTDFRVYQQDETTVAPQMPVKAMLPENWKDVLGKYLEEEENYNSKTSISLDDKVLDEIRAVTKYTSIEEKERETLIALFEGMYGKNNVQILNPTEFDKQFDNDTEQGKAQLLRDKGGMCYGYAVGTRLVLNSAVFNANTPMHEHAHIFMKVLKDSNPELYARGMELWKDTQTWKDVEGELSALGVLNNLDENTRNDRILSEIVARFSGNINEEVIARVTGVTDKNWIQKVVTWLKDIWQGVKSAFDKWLTKDLENLTAEQFAQMPVRAIYDEKERKSYTAKLKEYKQKNGVKETTNTTENSIEMHHNERAEKFSNLNKQAIALEKSVADELQTAQQNVVDRLIKNINIEVVSLSGEELLKEAMKYSSQIDEVLKTQDGNIYGFTVGGKIFLNKEIADTNTKMHELTHLWDASCRKNNPTLWKRGVELMKQTALWKEIKESGLYDNLTDDELASEVHARLTGEEAEQIFGQMNETARENGSNAQILNRLSVIQKLKNWIKDFWYWVKDTQIDWRDKDANKVSLKDFINMPIVDLVKGTELDGDFSTIQFKIDPKGRVQTPKEMMQIAYNLQMGYHWDKNKHEWVQNKNSLLTWIDRIFDRFSAVRRMVTIAKLDSREIKANPYYELIQADNVISGKEEVFAMEHAMRINAVIDKIIKATGWSRDEVMHLLIAKAMPGRTAKMIADKYKELKNKTLTILGAVSISGDDLTFVQQFDILLSSITTDDVDNKLSELGIDIDKIFVGKSDKVQRQKADFIQSVRLLIAGEKYRDTYSYDTTSINTTDGYRGENDTEGQVQGWNGEHDLYKSPLYKRFFGEDERSLHTPQEIMEKAKAEIGDELYNALTDEIKSAVDEVKKSAFIYNLVTKKTLQRFLLSDKYWLPLRGWDENLYKIFGEDTARQRILEKAKGRNTIADNPLQYLYSMYSTTIRQGVYNNAKKTLIDFLFKHGDLLIENGKTASAKKYKWKPKNREEYKDLIDESKKYLPDDEQDEGYVITSVPPDIDEVALDSNGQVNIIAGILSNDELDEKNLLFFDTLNIFDGTYDRAYTKGIKGLNKYIFTYKDERGIEYKVAINDKKLVKILNTPNLSSPLFSKGSYLIFARITRLMSSLMTSKNLGFMVRNLERDYQTAMFTEVPGMDNYRKHYNKHIHEDLKMLAKIILTPNETQRKLQEKQLTAEQRYTYEMYKQWLESGGATGMVYNFGTVARALESYAKTARGDIFFNLVKMPNEKTDKVMGVLKNIASLKYLELLSEVGENLIRFASYRAFLDEGMNEKEAAYQSRESTVNFTRWGVGGKFLNGFYPFFSATINALYRNGRLIVHNPKGFALQTAIYIGVGLMQGMFMAMIGSGDGDGDDKKNSILRYILGAISGGVVGGAVGGLLGGKKGMYIGAISSAIASGLRGAMGNNSPYENVSDYLKLRNFYLPISNLSNVYVSVPQEQVPSYALGLLTTQVALGLKTPIKATYEMMQTLVALFPESGANIVNGFMEYNGAEDKIKGTSVKERREIAYSLLPNAIQVFTDLDRNKNFMGYNIILPDSKNEDYHKTRASRTRGEYRTYGWSRALATAYNKLMNSSLRGVSKDEYQRLIESKNGTIISGEKLITVAPEDMQYIFSGLLPMYSNILTSTEDFVKSRKAVSLSNLPIISNAIASRESKERDFWQANAVGEQLEERYKSVKKNINSYSEKDLQQLQKDEYYKMFVAYDNQRANVLKERKKIKEQIDKIQKSKVLPRRQREELIEKKYDKINHLWDNWIKEYHIKSLEYITKK